MLREMGVQLWARGADTHEDLAATPPPVGGAARAPLPAASAAAPPASPASPGVGAHPTGSPAVAQASAAQGVPSAGTDADWRPAECLVVCDAGEAAPGDDGGADGLLFRMLHAVLLSPDAAGPAGRACRLALPTGRSADFDAAIATVRPRAILALGRAPAQALLGSDEPLGRLRGRLHARAGVPVVVTFAPAYLLRHPEEKAKAWADLCLLASALEPASD